MLHHHVSPQNWTVTASQQAAGQTSESVDQDNGPVDSRVVDSTMVAVYDGEVKLTTENNMPEVTEVVKTEMSEVSQAESEIDELQHIAEAEEMKPTQCQVGCIC